MINHDYDAVRYKDNTLGIRILEAIKIAAFYGLCFIMSIYAISLYSYLGKVICIAIIVGVIASLISWKMVPPERPNQIIAMKRNIFIYSGLLVGAHFLITKLSSLDPNLMGVSLGLPTGEVINNSALGWITMMIQFIIIGTPITHVGYEVKRIWTFYGFGFGKTTKRKRQEQLQKTIVRK